MLPGAPEAALADAFAGLVRACAKSIRGGGKLMFFGNGGSAADAQHLATELTIRYKRNRVAIAALALTTDTSALTAAGNDLGFEQIFARQIEALGKPGDVVVAHLDVRQKSECDCRAQAGPVHGDSSPLAFGGKGGGDMAPLADHLLGGAFRHGRPHPGNAHSCWVRCCVAPWKSSSASLANSLQALKRHDYAAFTCISLSENRLLNPESLLTRSAAGDFP